MNELSAKDKELSAKDKELSAKDEDLHDVQAGYVHVTDQLKDHEDKVDDCNRTIGILTNENEQLRQDLDEAKRRFAEAFLQHAPKLQGVSPGGRS